MKARSSEKRPTPSNTSIKSVLIANRGEIACRIIRTCQERGIRTIAVFSEADRYARHVRLADVSECIGEAESSRSYLNAEAVLAAALKHKADAIHPGYGFLSENAAFSEAVTQAGMRFIGPSPQAMRLVGDKLSAKKIATGAHVPMAPSIQVEANSEASRAAVQAFIKNAGLPIIVKAAGGGGGRGMRKVYEISALDEALVSASREAANFFKDGRVFCEKLVEHARHIEVQILGDQHGNVMHFFDRDCTMQRNHQKVLEEAPAPGLPDKLRAEIHASAVRLMKEAGYSNAGTVEFLLAPDGKFFFLEVNSRLQVEHPVTEAIFGVDLVALQIGVAEGKTLAELLPNGAPTPSGAALEARLCAEIPEERFVASTGKLLAFDLHPASLALTHPTSTLRVDSGFETGDSITHFYDSLIAKLIVHAPTRNEALASMSAALSGAIIEGVRVNSGFLSLLIGHSSFKTISHEINLASSLIPSASEMQVAHTRALLAALAHEMAPKFSASSDPWDLLKGFRIVGESSLAGVYSISTSRLVVRAIVEGPGRLRIVSLSDHDSESGDSKSSDAGSGAGSKGPPSVSHLTFVREADESVKLSWAGRTFSAKVSKHSSGWWVHLAEGSYWVTQSEVRLRSSGPGKSSGLGQILSHLPGKVLEVKAKPGDLVESDSVVIVIESMKMEHRIQAGLKGVIKSVAAEPGQVVQSGQLLALVEASPPKQA